jgi:hypothetical protein
MLALGFVLSSWTISAKASDLITTGVFDGPLLGGTPKAVELYVLNNIADLSIYGLSSANNGAGTTGTPEFTFPADSVTAGDFIYVASESTQFNAFFGFNPNYINSSVNINGDDAIELFMNGNVVDIFGDVDTDGSGQTWEYMDGWAYRNTTVPSTTFDSNDWSYSSPNALDGETSNASATTPFPVGTFTVTVQDVTPPTVVTQNITVSLDAAGNASITAAAINNGSNDAAGIASMTVTPSNFSTANVGANTVTLTVTDNNSNSATGTATVTVQDVTPPTVVTQNITIQLDASGNATLTAAAIDNSSSDAAGIASMTVTPSNFNIANVGANTVTLTVTDNNSNSATGTATVTLQDVTPPTVVTQNITIQLDASGNATLTAAAIDNSSSDAAGISSMTVTPSNFNIANVGANTVTLTVTDNNSNTATSTATVTVQDVTPPTVVTQNITVSLDAAGNASITAAAINNGSNDEAGIASMTVTPSDFSTANVGVNTVTLTVTDNNSNSATGTAIVTIQSDNDASVIITLTNSNVTEGSTTGSFDVVLNTQPTTDVTITITPDSQTTIDKTTLTFTTGDWNIVQTVTVTTIDDSAVEGNHNSTISLSVSSADPNYDTGASFVVDGTVATTNLSVNISDNDVATPISSTSSSSSSSNSKPKTMNFTIEMAGKGSGSVTITPGSNSKNEMECYTTAGECENTFNTGTKLQLTVEPDNGSEFSSWGNHSDCSKESFFLTSNMLCTAYFQIGPRTLTIIPADQGTVSSQPDGILCGPNAQQCDSEFNGGAKVTLAVTPTAGWLFDGWEGNGCENVITLTQNLICQPLFSAAPATPDDIQLTQPDGTVITTITPSNTTVGQPSTQTITLTNNGNTEMVLSDLTLPEGFSLVGTFPDQIPAGEAYELQVQLDANVEGVVQGNLSFNVNGEPLNYPVSGTVAAACADAARLYVAKTATGLNTGCNWIDAMPELQTALTAISEGQFLNAKEIWVAKGTYKPTTGTDRQATFGLMNNSAIYGGFAGHETELEQRNSSENQTQLSGDLGIPGEASDNSFHVVTSTGNQATALLNGIVITAGNANGEGQGHDACGGGILNEASSPTLDYVLIRGNQALNGGGICNLNGSQPVLKRSVISENTVPQNGGGVFNDTQSQPRLEHVFVTKNTAGNQGGGMMNQNGSNPVLSHVNVSSNTAALGGGLVNDNSSPLISHSIFSDNTASEAGGIFNRNQSAPQLSHVIISGNASEFAGAMFNQNSSPTLVQTTITENSAQSGSSGIVNQAGSQTIINNSILWENHYSLEAGGVVEPQILDDSNAQTIVNNSIVQGGFAGVGNLDTDPLFAEPVDDPIATHTTVGDFHLSAGSPAIDAGNNDLLPQDFGDAECTTPDGNTSEIIEIDFDGKPRIEDGNGDGTAQVDLGAYEAPSIALVTYPLTVMVTGEGSGTVSSNKAGILCGDDCSQDYQSGLEIVLIARAAEGSKLTSWFGDCQGTEGHAEVEMTGAKACEAQFDFIPIIEEPTLKPEVPTTETPDVEAETPTIPVDTTSPATGPTETPAGPTVVVVEKPDCPTSGDFRVVCNAGGEVITDLVVHEGGDLSDGVVETALMNKGRVSNLEVTETGSVTGGIVTGLNQNRGVMSDFEFVGYSLDGQDETGEVVGRISGQIVNRSPLKNAYFKDVRLDKNTHLQGNIILKGHILGDENKPATLDGAIIHTGTHVANVVIENTVIIKPNATLENATLQGLAVEHVTLSGRVQNTTSGIFRNVKLGPDAHVSGGTFLGTIAGEKGASALIEFAKIKAGTRLDNVRIGDDVVLEEGVILGEGVEFVNPPKEESATESQNEETATEETGGKCDDSTSSSTALNPDSDETIDSAACFTGQLEIAGQKRPNRAKLSKKDAQKLKVSFTINPFSEQVGSGAKILIVGLYQAAEGSSTAYCRHGNDWQTWDGEVGNLTTAQEVDALPENLEVQIFDGDLSSMPGSFTVYVGLQLNDGTIHYNGGELVQFEVE